MRAYVRNYWRPYFGDEVCIQDLTLEELDDFFFFLHDEKGLAGETVNKNINMANKCFKTLLAQKKIAANPLEGIERFKADNEERGIPTAHIQSIKFSMSESVKTVLSRWGFKIASYSKISGTETAKSKSPFPVSKTRRNLIILCYY